MNLSAFNLTPSQAQDLTGLVVGLLADLELVPKSWAQPNPDRQTKLPGGQSVVTVLTINGSSMWQVNGFFTEAQKEMVTASLRPLPLLAGLKWLGPGPLAFHMAQVMGLEPIYFQRQCLVAETFAARERDMLWQNLVRQGLDGFWLNPDEAGKLVVTALDPFVQVTTIPLPTETAVIVKWQVKHYLTAEQYQQYRRRGLAELGSWV